MDAPPTYQPPNIHTPPKKNNTLWIVLGVCVAGGCLCFPAILAAILFPVFAQAREAAKSTVCISNVKQLGLAGLIYSNDYDDKLPTSTKWGDQIKKYLPPTETKVFHCPKVQDPGGFGYAMNDKFSKVEATAIKKPWKEIVFFESEDLSWNAHSATLNYPNPPRHPHGVNVAFMDGHAKRVNPLTALDATP